MIDRIWQSNIKPAAGPAIWPIDEAACTERSSNNLWSDGKIWGINEGWNGILREPPNLAHRQYEATICTSEFIYRVTHH
jgi:hypothetical protein